MSFLNLTLWALVGMAEENHSQPDHPMPAVDSTEGRRNGKKVYKLPAEEGCRRLTKNRLIPAKIISVIGGVGAKSSLRKARGHDQGRERSCMGEGIEGTILDQPLGCTSFHNHPRGTFP